MPSLQFVAGHAVQIALLGETPTLTITAGDPIYYGPHDSVSATDNAGSLSVNSTPLTVTQQTWVRSIGITQAQLDYPTVPSLLIGELENVWLLPSGTDDTQAIIAAKTAGTPLGVGTFKISGPIPLIQGQGPELTIIQSTSAAGCVQNGPALGTLPTSDLRTVGGFTFNGSNLTTAPAVLLNTSGTTLEPIVIENCLGDGLIVAGQNCEIDSPNIAFIGGSGIVYDNGCGTNTIIKPEVSRCGQYHHESRQSVPRPAGAFDVPENNVVIDAQYEDQTGIGLGCYHQLAGSYNTFEGETVFFSPLNVSLVKLEPNTAPGRSGDANGRLYFSGSTVQFSGNNTGVGVGIEANAVSGGVAGVLPNGQGGGADVAVIFQAERVFSGLSIAEKWGTSTPIWARSPITKYNVTTEFQTNGTGAYSSVLTPDQPYGFVIPWTGGPDPQSVGAGTFALLLGSIAATGVNPSAEGVYYLDPADYPGWGTLYYRVKAVVATNATAPTVSFTFGLYPVSSVAGASNQNTVALGTVVSGSQPATFTTPAASSTFEADSGDFAAPVSAGYYALGVVSSGTTAASSSTVLRACLQYHRK